VIDPEHLRRIASGQEVAFFACKRFPSLFMYAAMANGSMFLAFSGLMPLVSFQYLLGTCPEPRQTLLDGAFLWPVGEVGVCS